MPDIESKLRYRRHIECTKTVEVEYCSIIVPEMDVCFSILKQYRVYKDCLFGASSISYPISYPISYTMYDFSSKTGASVPRPPLIDSNEDREIDFNSHLDNMDQDIPAGQFPT